MITETMTIHEALSELKMLDKRIQKKVNDALNELKKDGSIQKIVDKYINAD